MAGSYRTFVEKDYPGVMELLHKVIPEFEELGGEKRWRWLHRENPYIKKGEFPLWVSVKDDKILMNLSCLMIDLKAGERVLKGAWLVDVFRHPELKGIMAFPAITSRLRKRIDFMGGFGFSDDAYRFAEAFKWHLPGEVPLFVKHLSARKFVEEKVGKGAASGIITSVADLILKLKYRNTVKKKDGLNTLVPRRITSFDDEVDVLWNRVSESYKVMVVRKKDYLNWRFFRQPNMNYKCHIYLDAHGFMSGYSAVRTMLRKGVYTGIIADLFAEPDKLGEIVAHAESTILKESVEKIICYASHPALKRALLDNGYAEKPSSLRLVYDSHSKSYDTSTILSLEDWFLTKADSDADTPVN